MTGTDLCVNKPHQSRSYLNHLVQVHIFFKIWINMHHIYLKVACGDICLRGCRDKCIVFSWIFQNYLVVYVLECVMPWFTNTEHSMKCLHVFILALTPNKIKTWKVRCIRSSQWFGITDKLQIHHISYYVKYIIIIIIQVHVMTSL